MSEMAAVVDDGKTGKAPSMGTFERFLTLWVALCIVAGIGLGQAVPSVFHALGAATVAQVNLPVAVLVWLMIVPMLLKIDPAALEQVGNHWRGIVTTVGVNWPSRRVCKSLDCGRRNTLIVDDDAHQSGKLKSLGLYFAKRAMKHHVKCEARE